MVGGGLRFIARFSSTLTHFFGFSGSRFGFALCRSLERIHIVSASKLGVMFLDDNRSLRYVDLNLTVQLNPMSFHNCLSLEVLAAASNFNINTGTRLTPFGANDNTDGITRYLKWRNENDLLMELYFTTVTMLKLCERDDKDPNVPPRATPNDAVMKFLVEKGCGKFGFGRHVLSFVYGERGEGDLRGVKKERLLQSALKFNLIPAGIDSIGAHMIRQFWSVHVGTDGKIHSNSHLF